MPPIVVVRDLHKRYGATHAVRGVSFAFEAGEIFALLGPNGAGKTSTVECVIGLRDPDDGLIEICGIETHQDPAAVKQKIGAALQSTALQDKITPREALGLFGSLYRERTAPAELLERFSLTEKADAPVDSLSGGQRQRLAMALAFVNRPEVIFLDEPTAGLDPQSRREVHGEIRRMKSEGRAVLLTTHYIEEAEQLCDRVAFINEGKIIATGTPRELIARSAARPVVSLATAQPLGNGVLETVQGIEDLVHDGVSVRFRTADIRRTIAQLMGIMISLDVEITELSVRKATLEDVFLELTGSTFMS